MKTNELIRDALNWAVAKCEGATDIWQAANGEWCVAFDDRTGFFDEHQYSTDWARGGPIIEREHISIEATRVGGLGDRWMASDMGHCAEFADAPLIAAMRCYVASKLGDEIEIPKELT
jgi:hypothetical protein